MRRSPPRAVAPRMNLPNALTLGRIFLVPLFVVVLLTEFDGPRIIGISKELLGAMIFSIASATDWLDGYLARRRGQITWLGQVMDPIADKLLTSAAFISLIQLNVAPAWIVAVIIGRELAVTGLRSLAHTKGLMIDASPLGKGKMAAQVTAILLLLLGAGPLPWVAPLGAVALWVVLGLAVISAVDYYRRFQRLASARVPDMTMPRARSNRKAS
jgi:CDP-diacylglycerol--glycerol-3-phosphate 3-phosphatidyltransferase